ncbi:MAG: hypothetical protein AB8G99_27495, partial [Planctomycetaceae bacterium]
SADDAGVRKAFKQLSDDMKKKDYKSASLLITQNGLENFVASQFIGAAMMSQGFQGVPGKKFAVIKKYKLDSLSIDEPMGLDGEQASRKIHKLVLSRFKDNDDMLAALRSLTKRGVYLRLKNYYHCTTGGRLNKKWLSR